MTGRPIIRVWCFCLCFFGVVCVCVCVCVCCVRACVYVCVSLCTVYLVCTSVWVSSRGTSILLVSVNGSPWHAECLAHFIWRFKFAVWISYGVGHRSCRALNRSVAPTSRWVVAPMIHRQRYPTWPDQARIRLVKMWLTPTRVSIWCERGLSNWSAETVRNFYRMPSVAWHRISGCWSSLFGLISRPFVAPWYVDELNCNLIMKNMWSMLFCPISFEWSCWSCCAFLLWCASIHSLSVCMQMHVYLHTHTHTPTHTHTHTHARTHTGYAGCCHLDVGDHLLFMEQGPVEVLNMIHRHCDGDVVLQSVFQLRMQLQWRSSRERASSLTAYSYVCTYGCVRLHLIWIQLILKFDRIRSVMIMISIMCHAKYT